jgi:hypothetical protein
MIGPIFSINAQGDFGIIDDRLYLVPEFREMLALPNGIKLMQYTFCICDYYSPYIRISDPDDRALKVSNDVLKEALSKTEKELIRKATKVYKELQEHPLMEQYDVMKRMRTLMQKKIDILGISDGSKASDIMALSQQLVKYTMDMEKVEEQIRQKNAKIGGLSGIKRSLSIYEERVYKEQRSNDSE